MPDTTAPEDNRNSHKETKQDHDKIKLEQADMSSQSHHLTPDPSESECGSGDSGHFSMSPNHLTTDTIVTPDSDVCTESSAETTKEKLDEQSSSSSSASKKLDFSIDSLLASQSIESGSNDSSNESAESGSNGSSSEIAESGSNGSSNEIAESGSNGSSSEIAESGSNGSSSEIAESGSNGSSSEIAESGSNGSSSEIAESGSNGSSSEIAESGSNGSSSEIAESGSNGSSSESDDKESEITENKKENISAKENDCVKEVSSVKENCGQIEIISNRSLDLSADRKLTEGRGLSDDVTLEEAIIGRCEDKRDEEVTEIIADDRDEVNNESLEVVGGGAKIQSNETTNAQDNMMITDNGSLPLSCQRQDSPKIKKEPGASSATDENESVDSSCATNTVQTDSDDDSQSSGDSQTKGHVSGFEDTALTNQQEKDNVCRQLWTDDTSSQSSTDTLQSQLKKKMKRTQYSKEDLQQLNVHFQQNPWLSPEKQERLALRMGYTETQIKTWFQNKRASIFGSRRPKKRPLQELCFNQPHGSQNWLLPPPQPQAPQQPQAPLVPPTLYHQPHLHTPILSHQQNEHSAPKVLKRESPDDNTESTFQETERSHTLPFSTHNALPMNDQAPASDNTEPSMFTRIGQDQTHTSLGHQTHTSLGHQTHTSLGHQTHTSLGHQTHTSLGHEQPTELPNNLEEQQIKIKSEIPTQSQDSNNTLPHQLQHSYFYPPSLPTYLPLSYHHQPLGGALTAEQQMASMMYASNYSYPYPVPVPYQYQLQGYPSRFLPQHFWPQPFYSPFHLGATTTSTTLPAIPEHRVAIIPNRKFSAIPEHRAAIIPNRKFSAIPEHRAAIIRNRENSFRHTPPAHPRRTLPTPPSSGSSTSSRKRHLSSSTSSQDHYSSSSTSSQDHYPSPLRTGSALDLTTPQPVKIKQEYPQHNSDLQKELSTHRLSHGENQQASHNENQQATEETSSFGSQNQATEETSSFGSQNQAPSYSNNDAGPYQEQHQQQQIQRPAQPHFSEYMKVFAHRLHQASSSSTTKEDHDTNTTERSCLLSRKPEQVDGGSESHYHTHRLDQLVSSTCSPSVEEEEVDVV